MTFVTQLFNKIYVKTLTLVTNFTKRFNKYMKNLQILLLFLFFTKVNSQQLLEVEKVDTIATNFDLFIGRDVYNHFYGINQNALIKVANKEVFEYQNVNLGKLEHVDISNPLQPILFYKEFNTVVLLDAQLNITHKILGNEFNVVFEHVGLARQNNIWFYDSISQKFGLCNIVNNTLSFISNPFPTTFQSIKSTYNNFYWISNEGVFYKISFFGNISTIKETVKGETSFIIDEKSYLYINNNRLFFSSIDEEMEINLNENSFEIFCYNDGILSIFTNYIIYNYKINLP